MHASSFARVKTLIGFEPEEMMGLHAYDFFHPSDFKACQPNSERAIKCRLTCELCSHHTMLVCVMQWWCGWVWMKDVRVCVYMSERDRVGE